MAVYNGDRYINEAIDSILSQTYENYEFIIINDGSTDHTKEILSSFSQIDGRIQIIHQKNHGLIFSLNRGLELSRGKYLARLDADDISEPDRLETQVKCLEDNPEIVLVGSAYYVIDKYNVIIGKVHPPVKDNDIRWQMLFHNSFAHSSVMYRLSTIQEYQLQYEDWTIHSEDYLLWTQLLSHGSGYNLSRPFIKHRLHEMQIGNVYSIKQKQISRKISKINLNNIGIYLDDNVIDIYRDWFIKFPKKLSNSDLKLCLKMLNIIDTFGEQAGLDRKSINRIRMKWIDQMIIAYFRSDFKNLIGSGCLMYIINNYTNILITFPFRRIIIMINKLLRR